MQVHGCGSAPAGLPASATGPAPSQHSPFFRIGPQEACIDQCLPESISFAHSAMGMTPSPFRIDHSIEDVVRSAKSPGSAIRIPVGQLLDELSSHPACSAILVHSNGHSWGVIGEVRIDGEAMVQLVHGNEPGLLVSRSEIQAGGFREAWRLERGPQPIAVGVGSGTLEIDCVAKNLGVVEMGVPAKATFHLQNTGTSPLILANAESSCSCTMANLSKETELSCGESYELAVTLKPNNSASQRQHVTLEIRNAQDQAVTKQKLTVYASPKQSLPVLPTVVDFGAILLGGSSTRVVRVREVETIRFSLASVDVADLPLTHAIAREVDQSGLATYKISLELRPNDPLPGKYTGTCVVKTSSHTHPVARVPFQYEILPTVRVEPLSLAVGTVNVNQSHTAVLRIRSNLSEKLTVHVLKHPPECSIRENRDVDGLELIVTTTLSTPGIWQDEIGVQVDTDSGSQELSIRCTGLAR